MIRHFALASAILIAAGSAAPAMAGTATSDITVSATVPTRCTISTTALAFGNYDPIGTHATANLDATATVTTTCTNGMGTYVMLGQGANAGSGSSDASPVRRLKSAGSAYINYYIYQDSARTTVWGNTVGSNSVNVTGTGSAQNTPIYGRIPAGQAADATTYSDTVVATVAW
jgi:spore coat protein U-like protein